MVDSDDLIWWIDDIDGLSRQSTRVNGDLCHLVADGEYDHDAALEAFRGLVEDATVFYESKFPGEIVSETDKTDTMRAYRFDFEAWQGVR